MIRSRGFVLITAADFIVRSAYQMGKTPLLPIFAAALGAGDILLGFIVSVSTLTGMVLKPFVGILSDQSGRKVWLLVGTAFFAGMPFVYGLVRTPEDLFAVRVIHGLATAIYGPVTLAYVAELSRHRRAERLGWFSIARNAGYVVGPAAAGWMLLTMDPVAIFTVIGILSSAAFLPVVLLPKTASQASKAQTTILTRALRALSSGGKTPAVWLAGGLEAKVFISLYATKAFLPLHALSMGLSPAMVGAFFATQEAVHIVLNPVGGRIGDRLGHLRAVAAGMSILGVALPLLTLAETSPALMMAAALIGAGQALVFTSTLALVSNRVDERSLGTGMGLVGTMKNGGKVAGPALAGVLVYKLGFMLTFQLMGGLLLAGATLVWFTAFYARKPSAKRKPVAA